MNREKSRSSTSVIGYIKISQKRFLKWKKITIGKSLELMLSFRVIW